MPKRHFVILKDRDGIVSRYPLKKWLRENTDVLNGYDRSANTHYLRGMLKNAGWNLVELDSEMLVVQPGLNLSDDIRNFIEASAADYSAEQVQTGDEAEDGFSFELEHQLRDFLISNLSALSINGKTLKLYKDTSGRTGREYPTEVGFIDVLATDENDALYVFELKRGRTSDHTIGQILRYMGWCEEHTSNGQKVFGIIVAQSYDQKLKYAAKRVSDLFVFEYAIEFKLRDAMLT